MRSKMVPNIDNEIVRQICSLYGISRIAKLTENTKGEFNRIFYIDFIDIDNKSRRYVLRVSNAATKRQNLEFETRVLAKLRQPGFTLVPEIMPSTRGKLFEDYQGMLCIMQGYIEGENKYTWYSTHYTREEFDSAYKTLAKLHSRFREISTGAGAVLRDHKMPILARLLDFQEDMPIRIRKACGLFRGEDVAFLKRYEGYILDKIRAVHGDMVRHGYGKLSRQLIHGDYHLGNLAFAYKARNSAEDGTRVCGIFDFDWMQHETVVWEFAYSLMQVAGRWDTTHLLDTSKCKQAIEIYNNCSPQKISVKELQLLPLALQAAELFDIDFALDWCLRRKSGSYFRFIRHSIISLQKSEFEKVSTASSSP